MRLRFLVLLGVTMVPARVPCQAPRIHPAPEFIAKSGATNDVVFGGATAALPFIRTSAPIGVIGSEDGPPQTIFSRILSANFVDDTTVVALDGESSEVRVFSIVGRHLQTFGRAGSGPGEFRNPTALASTPGGEILVADLRRIVQVFRRGPRGYEYRRSMTLPFSVRSMCYLGNRLFINGAAFDDEKIIRAVDDSGKVTAEFGEIYRSPNPALNYQVATGEIACDPARNLIYYMPGSLLGEVRAFQPTGELVWRVRVTDFLNNRVVDEGGKMTVERSPRGANASGSITVSSAGVIAQWTHISIDQMKAREEPTRVQSVLIDPATGRAASLGTQLPLLAGRRGTMMIEQVEDPVPQLTLRRYSVGRP